jgi:hypothetical protein
METRGRHGVNSGGNGGESDRDQNSEEDDKSRRRETGQIPTFLKFFVLAVGCLLMYYTRLSSSLTPSTTITGTPREDATTPGSGVEVLVNLPLEDHPKVNESPKPQPSLTNGPTGTFEETWETARVCNPAQDGGDFMLQVSPVQMWMQDAIRDIPFVFYMDPDRLTDYTDLQNDRQWNEGRIWARGTVISRSPCFQYPCLPGPPSRLPPPPPPLPLPSVHFCFSFLPFNNPIFLSFLQYPFPQYPFLPSPPSFISLQGGRHRVVFQRVFDANIAGKRHVLPLSD